MSPIISASTLQDLTLKQSSFPFLSLPYTKAIWLRYLKGTFLEPQFFKIMDSTIHRIKHYLVLIGCLVLKAEEEGGWFAWDNLSVPLSYPVYLGNNNNYWISECHFKTLVVLNQYWFLENP